MSATKTAIDTKKINLGPCKVTFGGVELGRTEGETTFTFTTEYRTQSTEEDGEVMDIVTNHSCTVEIPIIYSDPESVAVSVPWATLTTDSTAGESKLEVGSAIGQVMNDYADELIIHPLALDDDDLSADIKLGSAYPMPQDLTFSHGRESTRTTNTMFKAETDANGNYFTLGDPSITAA